MLEWNHLSVTSSLVKSPLDAVFGTGDGRVSCFTITALLARSSHFPRNSWARAPAYLTLLVRDPKPNRVLGTILCTCA